MENFETEKFITEIESRPSIWDCSSEEYSNRELKKKCWEEIVDIFGGRDLLDLEKREHGTILQRRWKNLRGSFVRELNRQKQKNSGSVSNTRKSEYIYYKQLLFLQRVTAIKDSNAGDNEQPTEEAETIEPNKQHEHPNKKRKTTENKFDAFIETLNRSINKREKRERLAEEDDDRMFLLSLVKPLKDLPDFIKMSTKIELLRVINNAQLEGSSRYGYPSISHNNSITGYWSNHGVQEEYRHGLSVPSRRLDLRAGYARVEPRTYPLSTREENHADNSNTPQHTTYRPISPTSTIASPGSDNTNDSELLDLF